MLGWRQGTPRLHLPSGCGPTTCPSTHRSSYSFYLTVSLPGWPKVVFLSPLRSTTPSSSDPLLHTLYPLQIPQIRHVAPPTASRLPAVDLCKSYLTGFLLPLVCLLTPASPMSHLIIALLSSPDHLKELRLRPLYPLCH